MSSLQISLAVAGGVVLAALVAHGAWVARRNAPKQAQPDQPILDARNGTGTTKNVLNAQPDGTSMPTESAHQSMIIALLGTIMESALLATKDMI